MLRYISPQSAPGVKRISPSLSGTLEHLNGTPGQLAFLGGPEVMTSNDLPRYICSLRCLPESKTSGLQLVFRCDHLPGGRSTRPWGLAPKVLVLHLI